MGSRQRDWPDRAGDKDLTVSTQFGAYSLYYDLLYQDKDYEVETGYVVSLLRRFNPDCQTILELGCGTGKHAECLGRSGFQVTGVERSDTMLIHAQQRAEVSGGTFTAHPGDVRTFRCDRRFDAAISLFHVVSYQITNDDVSQTFATAAEHLCTGGIFLFDIWYGPAVLTLRPGVRVKRMENDAVSVIRIAEPRLDINRNRVDVTYTILVNEKASGHVSQLTETHSMRYYFSPELELLARQSGFDKVHSEEWVTGNTPGSDTWGVCFVVRKAS